MVSKHQMLPPTRRPRALGLRPKMSHSDQTRDAVKSFSFLSLGFEPRLQPHVIHRCTLIYRRIQEAGPLNQPLYKQPPVERNDQPPILPITSMDVDENMDADMLDDDTTEDTMMDLHDDSWGSDDKSLESDNESTGSDDDGLGSDDESTRSDDDDIESDYGRCESDDGGVNDSESDNSDSVQDDCCCELDSNGPPICAEASYKHLV